MLIGLAFLALVPFIWLICACFKQQRDIFGCAFLPWGHLADLTVVNFRVLFAREPVSRWLFNSLFLSCTQTVLVVVSSSLGGFALAKYRFAGRRLLMGLMLATMLMPGVVLIPSSWLLMYKLGWLNSYAAILVPGAVSSFGTFLFMQAMKAVPDELLQAARVDGCSEARLWWEVALPIVRPMIAAFTLLTFIGAWNSYLWPSIVLQDESLHTLPIGLATMVGLPGFDTEYGVLMAGTLLAVLPVMVLFFVLQRDFISGLASGAVKG
jgi:ABC-type glycerol-3-phosphate transport system permease component